MDSAPDAPTIRLREAAKQIELAQYKLSHDDTHPDLSAMAATLIDLAEEIESEPVTPTQ